MERTHHEDPGSADGDGVTGSLVPAELHDRLDYLLCKLADVTKKQTDETFLAGAGIRGAHHAVMRVLRSRGAISQRQLSAELFVDQSTVVDLIDQLQGQELVTRDRDPNDRRAYLLRLTPAGTRVLRKADRVATQIQTSQFEALDDVQLTGLRDAVTALLQR